MNFIVDIAYPADGDVGQAPIKRPWKAPLCPELEARLRPSIGIRNWLWPEPKEFPLTTAQFRKREMELLSRTREHPQPNHVTPTVFSLKHQRHQRDWRLGGLDAAAPGAFGVVQLSETRCAALAGDMRPQGGNPFRSIQAARAVIIRQQYPLGVPDSHPNVWTKEELKWLVDYHSRVRSIWPKDMKTEKSADDEKAGPSSRQYSTYSGKQLSRTEQKQRDRNAAFLRRFEISVMAMCEQGIRSEAAMMRETCALGPREEEILNRLETSPNMAGVWLELSEKDNKNGGYRYNFSENKGWDEHPCVTREKNRELNFRRFFVGIALCGFHSPHTSTREQAIRNTREFILANLPAHVGDLNEIIPLESPYFEKRNTGDSEGRGLGIMLTQFVYNLTGIRSRRIVQTLASTILGRHVKAQDPAKILPKPLNACSPEFP